MLLHRPPGAIQAGEEAPMGLDFEMPEESWVWMFPGETGLILRVGMMDLLCVSCSAKGITLAARPKFGLSTDNSGYEISTGYPSPLRYPQDFPNAGIAYDGFIFYDDSGKELTRVYVR